MRTFGRRVKKQVRALPRRLLARAPVRLSAKPDFLIIGAQKAGTSSLYSWLTKHPDVLAARQKELHYFDRRASSSPVTAYWVDFPLRLKMFALRCLRRRNVVTGEATPVYLFHPCVPVLVAQHLPDARLIVLLRDPVERAISHYWMEFNRDVEMLSLEEALAAEQDRIRPELDRVERQEAPGENFRWASYVARGQYAEQFECWLALFPRSQMLVIEFGQLVSDPLSVYEQTLRFLGVDPGVAPTPAFEAVLVGSRAETRPETVAWLRKQFQKSNERLHDLVGIDYNNHE
jgi:hypothetical protein